MKDNWIPIRYENKNRTKDLKETILYMIQSIPYKDQPEFIRDLVASYWIKNSHPQGVIQNE